MKREDLIDQILAELSAKAQAVQMGGLQGLTMGFGDEIGLTDTEELLAARERNPVSMSVGEALGALPYGFFGSKILKEAAHNPATRFQAATGASAAHGALAGLGAGETENATMQDRLMSAGIGAGIGGAVGGLAVPGVRAAGQLDDNLPALLGRQRNVETPGYTQTALGQGSRKSAPLVVELMGEGTPQERAQRALAAALQLDESDAMRAGGGRQTLGRFADQEDGRSYVPFDSEKVGRSTRGVIDYAAQSDAGSERLNEQADMLVQEALKRQMKASEVRTANPTIGNGKLNPADKKDLLAAFDMPAAHKSWLSEVAQLDDLQREALGEAVLRQTRKKFRATGAGEAEGFRAALRDKQTREKFRALGIDVEGFKKPPIDDPKLQKRVDTLRGRATKQPSPTYADGYKGMANMQDRMLAAEGQLSPEDALALIEASMTKRRGYLVTPQHDARLLKGRYEAGAKWAPKDWFNSVTADELERAIIASQSVAAGLHGAPHWFGSRDKKK